MRVELASARKLRERNKVSYRLAHWPIWIAVFFLAPGPLIFRLFARGFDVDMAIWLVAVIVATGLAGLRGQLPGVEPKPYILRFTEDRPNPLYRRICYTVAWSELIAYALLNATGLTDALISGHWRLQQIYRFGYLPLVIAIWLLGALGQLPRVRSSTAGEGTERRYFYGSLWATTMAEAVLGVLWVALPRGQAGDAVKLGAFLLVLLLMGAAATQGRLPRTRPIVPGEVAVSD